MSSYETDSIYHPWRRHGIILFLGGLTFINFGFQLFDTGAEEIRRLEMIEAGLYLMSLDQWATSFIGLGLVVSLTSRMRRFNPGWGYAILTGHCSAWASVYILGFVFFDAPMRNLYTGVFWSVLALLWWAIAGLVNPTSEVGRVLVWARARSKFERRGLDESI